MNRFAPFLLLLLLAGCASPPPERPPVLVDSERYLHQGVAAFHNDEYRLAADLFQRALHLYQGIDHRRGELLCRLNLAETALAVDNHAAAEGQLAAAAGLVQADPALRPRLALLRARLALRRGMHAEAGQWLEGLLPGFDGERVTTALDSTTLAVLAVRTRLAFDRGDEDAGLWSRRFSLAVGEGERPLYRARALRFEAALAPSGQAAEKLDQALALYKAVPYRPGIAATLEAQAALHMSAERWLEAEDALRRALAVRSVLLNRADTADVLRRLMRVNTALGRSEQVAALERWVGLVESRGFQEWNRLRGELAPY